ncbi:hypothetical protein CHS0354_017671 [Potamilus streckersoni]|uniref:Uncharacterized protein n=1 Tax=Potamilus streckersoni TaxID=2493646 RepID=A0AAE0S859_9BIVA|nr:hypothetical protein CHS0354_017671 [Potamilus streckersoni]
MTLKGRSSRRIRTFTFLMVLCSVLHVFGSVNGQWAQTLGWGGAGYGKRSLTWMDLIRVKPRPIKMLRDVLQVNPNLKKLSLDALQNNCFL